MAEADIDFTALDGLQKSLAFLKFAKPTERSEKARHYAVAITEIEKVVAYVQTWIVSAG